jgi:hypothetical protein
MVEMALQHLLQPHRERNDRVMAKPNMDIYFGNTRVFKRTSRLLLFAFCPDIGPFLEPVNGILAVRLSNGISNSLSVKLAVLYMEQYLLTPEVHDAPWRVRGNIASYIYLAELFTFIGMPETCLNLENTILCRRQEYPLRFA